VKQTVVLASLIIAALSLGGCVSSGATSGAQAYASTSTKQSAGPRNKQANIRDPWTIRTPFGVLYSQVPRQRVAYKTSQAPGTIVVNTRSRYLYYVLGHNEALRYSIAVGQEGYGWSGVSTVSAKREWPDWTPTPGILRRYPNLPRHMEGGPRNPLGARALYLGGTLYRIHGTNEPWKIGSAVSSGCIRLTNNDIVDLYNRTHLGAKVIVR
jgi:lipoprotein-anchoring transpeptidase ErfK/SrfK